MIPKIPIVLVLIVAWFDACYGASFSKVHVQNGAEVLPIEYEYIQYGAPSVAYAGAPLARLQAAPVGPIVPYSNYEYVPCVPPACAYPGQVIAAVAQAPSANIVSYNAPISNLPVVVSGRSEPTGYEYSYVVYDESTGDHKTQSELSDGSVVRGEYSFLQPDGYIREVKYVADELTGFNAVVKNYLPVHVAETKKIEHTIETKPAVPCPEHKMEKLKAPESSESNESKGKASKESSSSEEKSFEKKSGEIKASKESSSEEKSSKEKPKLKKSSEETSKEESSSEETSAEKHHGKKTSEEKSKEKNSSEEKSKEKKGSAESASKSAEKITHEHMKAASPESKSAESSAEATSGEASKEKPESKEKDKSKEKSSQEASKETNESVEIISERHLDHEASASTHSLVGADILVPYNDIIRCIEAALKGAHTAHSAAHESPLTYLVINKPC